MAVFCNEECEDMGAICDFCKHYIDDCEDTDNKFAGEGICAVTKERVDATDHCDEYFHCFMAERRGI
jgi:hypothetical protein